MASIISSEELEKIISAIKENLSEIEISPDLGISKKKITIKETGFTLDKKFFDIGPLLNKRRDEKCCYLLLDGELEKVQYYSEGLIYKLVPTSFRPILQISGTSMHKKAFVDRIKSDSLTGTVLDSGTGLGYSAIAASETATKVITIERDENVLDIAKINPYSQKLFNEKKINIITGDLVNEIKKFKDSEFSFIILDGGTPRSSGEFFSLANYLEAFRVLKKEGRLYHYIPKVQINSGRDFISETIKRMNKAGLKLFERNEIGSYAIFTKS